MLGPATARYAAHTPRWPAVPFDSPATATPKATGTQQQQHQQPIRKHHCVATYNNAHSPSPSRLRDTVTATAAAVTTTVATTLTFNRSSYSSSHHIKSVYVSFPSPSPPLLLSLSWFPTLTTTVSRWELEWRVTACPVPPLTWSYRRTPSNNNHNGGGAPLAGTHVQATLTIVLLPISHSRGDRKLAVGNFPREGRPPLQFRAQRQATGRTCWRTRSSAAIRADFPRDWDTGLGRSLEHAPVSPART